MIYLLYILLTTHPQNKSPPALNIKFTTYNIIESNTISLAKYLFPKHPSFWDATFITKSIYILGSHNNTTADISRTDMTHNKHALLGPGQMMAQNCKQQYNNLS